MHPKNMNSIALHNRHLTATWRGFFTEPFTYPFSLVFIPLEYSSAVSATLTDHTNVLWYIYWHHTY